jgi:hypothetical protein
MDTVDWTALQAMTIGTTQVQPGQYTLRAEEGKPELQVVQRGKVIATIPGQWVQLPAKAQGSEIETSTNKVTQVKFAGRPSALQFN